ncbi:MAG: alpha/beta hydrolase [Gammaproteobacteria bacterium]|nr:alpha/beta hydrolase [Gammaproteobacteria bacterium]
MLAALVAASTAPALADAPAGAPAGAVPAVSFITAPDGVPLCVAEAGNPAGPPIVLIHGYSQTYAVFSPQFGSELAARYRLLALDLRGHGCSGKPAEPAAYAPKAWAGDIAALLAAKRVVRPLLVGWSAGGYWIADYVREHGTAGIAGILLAGSHGGLMPADINPALPELGRQMRAANETYPPDIPAALARADQFAPLMAARPVPEDVRRTFTAATLMLPAYARRAMASRSMDNADLIRRFDLPVLFILGDRDRTATPAQMGELARRLPDANLHVYEGTGHASFAEEPARFNRDLDEFARRVRPGVAP